jgi:hypothetical protein
MEDFTLADDPPEEFTGVRINPRDAIGHLLLIWVIEYLPHKPTQFTRPDKPSDVIVVDVVDLDLIDPETEQPGLLARHTWWRQAKLIQKLKQMVGNPTPFLAYMGKGGASQGFNAPFVLNSAKREPAAEQRAREWYARNPGFQPSSPYDADPVVMSPDAPAPPPMDTPPAAGGTLLEQLARSAQAGADRVMGRPPLPGPPSQGPVPF